MQQSPPLMACSCLALGLALCISASAAPGASVDRASPAASGAGARGQCLGEETVIYTCRFDRSVGSVCADGSRVHYRFGPPHRPEIELSSAGDWSNVRIGRVVGQEGGHQSHVRFTNGRYHYVVYEGVDGAATLSPGRRYSGIHVVAGPEGSEPVAELVCRNGEGRAGDLSIAVTANAPAHLRSSDELWEQRSGPFDAWF